MLDEILSFIGAVIVVLFLGGALGIAFGVLRMMYQLL